MFEQAVKAYAFDNYVLRVVDATTGEIYEMRVGNPL